MFRLAALGEPDRMSYYLSTIVVFFGVDLLAAWALNIQFGWAGVPNFAFIIFQAIGAYAAAVVSLGPDSGANSFQRYILGAPACRSRCRSWSPPARRAARADRRRDRDAAAAA